MRELERALTNTEILIHYAKTSIKYPFAGDYDKTKYREKIKGHEIARQVFETNLGVNNG